MSSILLANPFVTSPSQIQQASEKPVPTALIAVAPAQASGGTVGSGSATSHSGAGYGQGDGTEQQKQLAALYNKVRSGGIDRPQNATATSVVSAQAKRVEFVEPVDMSDMPDPIPTSPFLEMMSVRR